MASTEPRAAAQQALAEPAQEPVGIVTKLVKGGVTWNRWPSDMPDGTKLYAAPPQRKPLTDEVIADLWHQNGGFHHHFARAIERWLRGHA